MNDDAATLLAKLGEKIDPGRKVRDLKIAQKQMVEIAKAISFNVELLVMDEPTSVLTGKETPILFDLIANLSAQGIAVVYISHRLKEIIDVCHKVTVLRDGSLVATKNVAEVTAARPRHPDGGPRGAGHPGRRTSRAIRTTWRWRSGTSPTTC